MVRVVPLVALSAALCAGFAPPSAGVALRFRPAGVARRAAEERGGGSDGEEVAYPFTAADPKLEQSLMETVNEGIERHPVLVRSVAERTAEMLETERPLNSEDDDSIPARLERFFVGLVRHPAMLWGTFLRVTELLEEELVEKGDEESAAQADKVRQVRIAAEAVRESRKI